MIDRLRELGRHTAFGEAVRYIAGGLSTMVVCWGSCFALVESVGLHYLVATNTATFIAWIYSYMINKYLVFRNRVREHAVQGSRFVILQACLLAVANGVLVFEVRVLGMHYLLGIAVISVVVAILNFTFMKLVVFRTPPAEDGVRRPA